MHAVGRNMEMTGTKLELLFAAPIENDMLLGLNFLLRYHAKVHLKSQVLHIGDENLGETESFRVLKLALIES